MISMKKLFSLSSIALITLLLLTLNVIPAGTTTRYAEVVKDPLYSMPKAILKDEVLEVMVKTTENVESWKATISNVYGSFELQLQDSKYENGMWILRFKMPENIPAGLDDGVYTLKLTFINETGTYSYVERNAVWVLNKYPSKLRIVAFADVKTPPGKTTFYEAAKEINLLNPDFSMFLGDLVETPTGGWKDFLKGIFMLKDPVFIVIGNHEYDAMGRATIYEKIIGPRYYYRVIGDFLIVALDSKKDGYIDMDQLNWLEQILSENREKVKIIGFHHPLFSPWKIKNEGLGYFKMGGKDPGVFFDELAAQGLVYGDWNDHLSEAKKLFELIIKYDVLLILTEHVHTDLNVIVEDNVGKKHYFICPAALAVDIPSNDIRGFKLITIYANNTLNEKTLYYDGTGLFEYPNSIPIDNGKDVPYRLGYLEYYTRNGTEKEPTATFYAKNDLNQAFRNVRAEFFVPSTVPLEKYTWYPKEPKTYDITKINGYYYVRVYNITLGPEEIEWYVFSAEPKDEITPQIKFEEKFEKVYGMPWTVFTVYVEDKGWGIRDLKAYYSIEGSWKEAALVDFRGIENGLFKYVIWTKEFTDSIQLKVVVTDLAGNSAEQTYTYTAAKPTTTSPTYKPITPIPQETEQNYYMLIAAAVIGIAVVAIAIFVIRKR